MLDDKDEFESAEAAFYRRQIERLREEQRELIIGIIKVVFMTLLVMLPTIFNVYKLLQEIRAGR